MRKSPALALTALAVTGLVLAGCSSSSDKTTTATPSTSAATFPVTVGDVTMAAKPTHIVSLSPTATDMLYAIGAGPQVAATDKNSDDSDFHGQAKPAKTDLDSYTPSAEAIAATNPDLVVIANDTNKIKDQLTKLKIPVYLAPAAVTIVDTYKEETELGQLTGQTAGAAKVVSDEKQQITAALAGLPSRSKQLTYFYELDQTLYSATSKTFIGSLFSMANMINVADPADTDGKAGGYPQLTAEAVIKANPDLIFLADTVCCQQSAVTVAKRPGWSSLSAVTGNHVVALNDSVASQWGTQVPQLLGAIVAGAKAVPAS
jgi:iron complex transport system substrate-binding protein